jgi:hypothetical protein
VGNDCPLLIDYFRQRVRVGNHCPFGQPGMCEWIIGSGVATSDVLCPGERNTNAGNDGLIIDSLVGSSNCYPLDCYFKTYFSVGEKHVAGPAPPVILNIFRLDVLYYNVLQSK